jgi:hypothetical protein
VIISTSGCQIYGSPTSEKNPPKEHLCILNLKDALDVVDGISIKNETIHVPSMSPNMYEGVYMLTNDIQGFLNKSICIITTNQSFLFVWERRDLSEFNQVFNIMLFMGIFFVN